MKVEKFGRVFFDWTETPSVLMDAGGVIRLANPAFQALTKSEQPKNTSFTTFLNGPGKVAFRKFLNGFILTGAEAQSDRFQHFFVTEGEQTGKEWEWRFARYEHFYLVQGKACGPDNREAFFERHGSTGIAIVTDGVISDVNNRFLELFGYNQVSEVAGKQCADFAASEFKSKLECDEYALDGAIALMRKDGSRFPAKVRFEKTSLNDRPATLMRIDVVPNDTKTLMESGLLFGAMFDSAATGIVLVNKDGVIAEANRAFCEMLGYEKEQIPGSRSIELIYRKDRKIFRVEVEGLLKGEPRFRKEIRLRKRNRRLLYTDLTVDLITVAGGESYFLATVIDIDKRVKAEKNLTLRAQELVRSNRELENFATIASHDLQEPLRSISSFVQLLERRYRGKLDEDADQYISHVVQGTFRMKELIKDLLEYSRLRKAERELEQVNLNDLLDEVNINLQDVTETNEANILNEFLPTVRCNKTQMIQLFQNLIENAIKFKGDDVPEILVTFEDHKDRYQFSVRDNGIGIEPQYGNKIFSLFQRLNEREQYEGNGIGLAVCKKIVENHGGKIWIDPQVNQGSIFHFTLRK